MTDAPRVTLGGKEYPVLPLNLAGMRKLATSGALKDLDGFDPSGLMVEERHVNAVTSIIHAVLSRGTPDVTREQIEEALDVANMPTVIPAVMEGAGLVRKTPGEAVGPKS